MIDTITNFKELMIDISDTEAESDPESEEEMYGEGYVSVGGSAPRCGKTLRMDVKMAGSLNDLSMKESAIETRITIDTIYLDSLYSSIN